MKQFISLLALVLYGPALFSADVTSNVESGRHIYFHGESLDGQAFTANVGGTSIAIPATALPCAGCHGYDGQGRPEGGVKPTNINWDNLSRSYGGTSSSGRSFKAYDEKSFLIAVTEGIDSNGNKLDSSMPRYNISKNDARDLVAYLKVIREDYDPGISDEQIVVATLLPDKPSQKFISEAVTSVIRARMQEINEQGGIFGRQLSLKVVGYQDHQSFIGQTSDLLAANEVFALISPFSSRADQALTDMVEEAKMPSIAPFTQFPAAQGGRHQYTFYLYGGLDMQIAALIERILDQSGDQAVVVLHNADGLYSASAEQAMTRLNDASIEAQLVSYDPDQPLSLADTFDLQKGATSVLFVGAAEELKQLTDRMSAEQKKLLAKAQYYLPGFFVTSHILQLPEQLLPRLNMAYLTVPGSEDQPLKEFQAFMVRNQLDLRFLNIRLFAYSAMNILEEGIKRSGKRINRKKLVDAIEGLYEFDVGLNRPISYGSRRRMGLKGAFIVSMKADNRRLDSGEWLNIPD